MTIEQMLKNMGIKRIQYGAATIASGSTNVKIAIDHIDPNKSLVIINGGGFHIFDLSAKTVAHEAAYLSGKNADSITINVYNTLDSSGRVSHQIVEFM